MEYQVLLLWFLCLSSAVDLAPYLSFHQDTPQGESRCLIHRASYVICAISHLVCYMCQWKMEYQVLLLWLLCPSSAKLWSAAVPQTVKQQAPHAQNIDITYHASYATHVKEAGVRRSLWQPLALEVLQQVCPFE